MHHYDEWANDENDERLITNYGAIRCVGCARVFLDHDAWRSHECEVNA